MLPTGGVCFGMSWIAVVLYAGVIVALAFGGFDLGLLSPLQWVTCIATVVGMFGIGGMIVRRLLPKQYRSDYAKYWFWVISAIAAVEIILITHLDHSGSGFAGGF